MMYRRQMHSSTRSFSTVAAKSEGGSDRRSDIGCDSLPIDPRCLVWELYR